MSKTVVIAAIVVAAMVVGGGVAAVILMNNQGGDSSVSFDKRYFDIKGAQSLAIYRESNTSSSAASNIIFSTDSNGPAMMALGDDAGEKTALYKKDNLGNYVKVKLYETQEKAEEGSEGDEIKNDYSPVAIYITDNGKYAYLIMGVYKVDSGETIYSDVKPIIVSIETGKIYELPKNNSFPVNISSKDAMLSNHYNDFLLTPTYSEPVYGYIGCSGSVIFLRMHSNNGISVYSAVEDNGEILLKEIANDKTLSNLGNYRIYANGIIRALSTSNLNDSTLIFADGKLKQKSNDGLFECGNYLCTQVTYNDPATKYFPSSATVITGYDEETKDIKTETREFTNQQSYEMALKTRHQNQIGITVGDTSAVIAVMNSVNSISRIELRNDLTFFDQGAFAVPFKLGTVDPNHAIFDDSASPGNHGYIVINGHICQYAKVYSRDGIADGYALSDVVLSDYNIYMFASNTMNQYNLFNGEHKAIKVPGLFSVTTMEIDNDRVLITGLSESGQAASGELNFSDTSASLVYTKVMREVRIAALS